MILLVGSLQRSLLQAELVSDILEFVDGKPVWSEPHPNPFYVSDWKRTLFSYFVDFLPAGQSVQLSNLEAERVARFPALSLLFTLLTTGIGLLAFSRKDIK